MVERLAQSTALSPARIGVLNARNLELAAYLFNQQNKQTQATPAIAIGSGKLAFAIAVAAVSLIGQDNSSQWRANHGRRRRRLTIQRPLLRSDIAGSVVRALRLLPSYRYLVSRARELRGLGSAHLSP